MKRYFGILVASLFLAVPMLVAQESENLDHAELGAFAEGLAMAEEGRRIAETVNQPFSLIQACYGISVVYQRQGDVPPAIPLLERALGLCQDWHIPLFLPLQAAALGMAYTLERRVAEGLALARAFTRISNVRLRRRIVDLVEEMAAGEVVAAPSEVS